MKFRVIVPTLNAAADWPRFAPALLACVEPSCVLILDSSSSDGTVELATAAGMQVHPVERAEFDHGRTRQLGAEIASDAEFLVYLTQDAVLADSRALTELLAPFEDPRVGGVYGRQLPRPEAGPIEAHARLFNYPAASYVRTAEDRRQFGLRTAFFSDSMAAYRREALMKVGGFPSPVLFGEDTMVAARLLLAGYAVAYAAGAQAVHSHDYTPWLDLRRYFDVGVLHQRELWMLEQFGSASGEGKRFVLSEWKYLWARAPWRIPETWLRTAMKLAGYRLGRHGAWLPTSWKWRCSLNRHHWK